MSGIEHYVIYTTVEGILERFRKDHVSGVGKDAIFTETPLGWFMYLHGSHEAIHLGSEKPSLAEGDSVRITFERIKPRA